MPTSTLFKKVEHFSKIRSYSRLSSKFDGRKIWVDVLQECCGTPVGQAQKRREFADVSQNPKRIANWAQNRKRYTYVCSKTEEKGNEVGWARTGAENQ